MKLKSLLTLFAAVFIIDFLTIYLAPRFLSLNERFIYKSRDHPNLVNSLANFDGVHYIFIAKNGYQLNEYAFFPLYPALIKLFSPVFAYNYPVAGFLISISSFILGSIFLSKLLMENLSNKDSTKWFFVFLITFPTSFYLYFVYSEGLLYLLLVLTLYFMLKKKLLLTLIFSYFASLTRFIGTFLIIPLILIAFKMFRLKKQSLFLSTIGSIIGLLEYFLYLFITTGDPLRFFHSQTDFGNQRTLQLVLLPQVIYRYLKIFLTAKLNFQFFVALMEFVIFAIFLIALIYYLVRFKRFSYKNPNLFLGLGIFSLINLILPTLTGTLLSIPRIALMSLTFFLVIVEIKSILVKSAIAFIFTFFHIISLAFFSRGYFIS